MRRGWWRTDDLFPEELDEAFQEIERRQERVAAKRDAQISATQRELIGARERWAESPFASRIDRLVSQLEGLGAEAFELLAAIVSGTVLDIERGRLDEALMSFREAKAQELLARLGERERCGAVTYVGLDLQQLCADEPDVAVLPEEIKARFVQVMTAMGEQLAGLGFTSHRVVRGNCPPEAKVLADRMRNCLSALILLGVARRQAARPQKRWNPDKLDRAEVFATEMLGMDTKKFSQGVD